MTPQTGCTYSISPSDATVDPAGGTVTVQITTGTGCSWQVLFNADWFRPSGTSPTTGVGNASVMIEVDSNDTGAARTGTAIIAGQTLTITQEAGALTETLTGTVRDTSPTCTFTVDLPNTGGTDPCRQFMFTASSGGQVTATLTRTDGATDLDLYLVRGGNILAMSLQAPRPSRKP